MSLDFASLIFAASLLRGNNAHIELYMRCCESCTFQFKKNLESSLTQLHPASVAYDPLLSTLLLVLQSRLYFALGTPLLQMFSLVILVTFKFSLNRRKPKNSGFLNNIEKHPRDNNKQIRNKNGFGWRRLQTTLNWKIMQLV